MKEDSVQEIICKEVCPYFGLDAEEQNDNVVFMGSGREDVDVCFKLLFPSFMIVKSREYYMRSLFSSFLLNRFGAWDKVNNFFWIHQFIYVIFCTRTTIGKEII